MKLIFIKCLYNWATCNKSNVLSIILTLGSNKLQL